VIKVSRTNPSWWLTSFFLAAGICLMALVGNLGVMSHTVAEARDDKDAVRRALYDGTRLMGTFTIGLLLTYVFQVEISPYGQPVEYWQTIPTSTMIYVLGMAYILIQSMAGLIAAMFFPTPLQREGFVGRLGRAYKIDKLPVEGKVSEEGQPLLLKKFIPEKNSEDKPAEETAVDNTADEFPIVDGKTDDEKAAEAKEAPEQPPVDKGNDTMNIPKSRKSNARMYNVMSVEEAGLVNIYVRRLFLLKLGLIFLVLICTLAILLSAKQRYKDAIDAASG
jgi:hypothetical protein